MYFFISSVRLSVHTFIQLFILHDFLKTYYQYWIWALIAFLATVQIVAVSFSLKLGWNYFKIFFLLLTKKQGSKSGKIGSLVESKGPYLDQYSLLSNICSQILFWVKILKLQCTLLLANQIVEFFDYLCLFFKYQFLKTRSSKRKNTSF